MSVFTTYTIRKDGLIVDTNFVPSTELPKLPITTPFTFPFRDDECMLALDKMGWWNPLGGHLEINESLEDTIRRESLEEAGVIVNDIKVFGYVKAEICESNVNYKYPEISILPMTHSRIVKVIKPWVPKETKSRALISKKEVINRLTKRDDNKQMLEIFLYLISVE